MGLGSLVYRGHQGLDSIVSPARGEGWEMKWCWGREERRPESSEEDTSKSEVTGFME